MYTCLFKIYTHTKLTLDDCRKYKYSTNRAGLTLYDSTSFDFRNMTDKDSYISVLFKLFNVFPCYASY